MAKNLKECSYAFFSQPPDMSNNSIQMCQIVVDTFVKYFNTTWDTGIEERDVRASGKQLEQNNIVTNIEKMLYGRNFLILND